MVSQLTSDLDGSCDRDKACLNSLLSALSDELQFTNESFQTSICKRSTTGEVHVLLLKLICKDTVFCFRKCDINIPNILANLLQRSKSSSSTKSSSSSNDPSSYVVRTSATFLHKTGIINYCLRICQTLLNDYWKHQTEEESSGGKVFLLN